MANSKGPNWSDCVCTVCRRSLIWVCTVCLDLNFLKKVHSFRLLSCFKLTELQNLIIYLFVVNMQEFQIDMKIFFHALEFQIALGATFRDSQLAPSKLNPWGASGQLLISNTVK